METYWLHSITVAGGGRIRPKEIIPSTDYISEYRNHLNIDQIENELNHENITDINQYTMEEYLFGPIHEEGVRFNVIGRIDNWNGKW